MKGKFLLLFLIFLLPIFVYADTCDNSKIVISDINTLGSNGYVEEINTPIIEGQSVSTNLKLYDVGDSITYSFLVKNNSSEDYDLSKNVSDDENVSYEIISDSTIKAGEEKTVQLKVTYKNRVDDSKYVGGKYVQHKELNILLGDNVVNPSTGLNSIIIFFILISFFVISVILMKRDVKSFSLVIIMLLLIPVLVQARCQYRININSNIEFKKVIPNDCRYDGELVPGSEYVNGQYTYRYICTDLVPLKSSGDNDSNLIPIEPGLIPGGEPIEEMYDCGWKVKLTDKGLADSVTTKLCTSINKKPITSMRDMFAFSKTTSIDFSSFDTSNVTDMYGMFDGSNVQSLDLSNFDTSNVTDMSYMFMNSNVTSLNISSFDTRNIRVSIGMLCVKNYNDLKVVTGPSFIETPSMRKCKQMQ